MSEKTKDLLNKQIRLLDNGWLELQDIMGDDLAIVNAARVSFLGESKGDVKDKKLLFYLMKHNHSSVFEQVEFKFRIRAPLVVWWQFVRHRTWCLSGDTVITFNRPDRWEKGIHTVQTAYKNKPFSLKRLFVMWSKNQYLRDVIKKMLIRVYDEKEKKFTVSHIKSIIHSGLKEVFEITLEDGKKLKCTKDHLILTKDGWKRLEDAIGLEVSKAKKATMSKTCYVATNGTENLWRSFDWLKKQKEDGLSVQDMADKAGCSYHTIRKWLKINGLQFDHLENLKKGHLWNKGKTGYKINKKLTKEYREQLSKRSKGENSNFWKGGITNKRSLIGRWTTDQAPNVHKKFNYTCQYCFERGGKLHAHHIKPVVSHPELAMNFENLITVCVECHKNLHRNKEMARSKKGTPLTNLYKKVRYVEYIGLEETYDLEIKEPHHNFLANGIIVHNSFNAQSGRYTPFEEDDFYIPQANEWRLQSKDNKQGSDGFLIEQEDKGGLAQFLTNTLEQQVSEGYNAYKVALGMGVAKEQARLFLKGFGVYYTWVCKVDAHNLMNFLSLRMASDAQYEIRVYAQAIYEHFFKPALPWTAEAFQMFRLESKNDTR